MLLASYSPRHVFLGNGSWSLYLLVRWPFLCCLFLIIFLIHDVVKFLPAWIPGAGFQAKAQEMSKVIYNFCDKPFAFVKHQMVSSHRQELRKAQIMTYLHQSNGRAADSLASDLLENGISSEVDEDTVKFVSSTLSPAGAETVRLSLFATYITSFTGLSESDSFGVGNISLSHDSLSLGTQACSRIALWGLIVSQNSLIDLNCLILTLWWRRYWGGKLLDPLVSILSADTIRYNDQTTPTWIGVPHCSLEEDTYMGYRIPKGTVMLANIWYRVSKFGAECCSLVL